MSEPAAPPPTVPGGKAAGAAGQIVADPASLTHPDTPQASVGANSAPMVPSLPGQPPAPPAQGGQGTKPGNTTQGGQPPAQPGDGTSGQPPDFAGSLRRIANINATPPEQRGHKTTQADLAQARGVVQARMADLKAKGGRVTLDEATELDQAEKSEAVTLKTELEGELRKNGSLTPDQTNQLNQAKTSMVFCDTVGCQNKRLYQRQFQLEQSHRISSILNKVL